MSDLRVSTGHNRDGQRVDFSPTKAMLNEEALADFIYGVQTYADAKKAAAVLWQLLSQNNGNSGEREKVIEEWQPIETAPRDGTNIIVYRPKFHGNYIPQVGTDYWMTKGLFVPTWGKSRKDVPPTHWQPFPKPPAIRALKSGEKGS